MTKLEHMILHLKLITLRNNYTLNFLNLHHKNNLCLLNQKTPITKINLHIKNFVHTVTEQITPSLLVSKNNELMKTNEMLMLDQNLHKNYLYNTSVLLLMTKQKIMIIDRSRSTSRNNSYNKTYSQNRYRFTSRDRFSYDNSTTPTQYSR